ncbi:3-methyl-2-oxobutanoate hydroxymethyltransferase [Frateuria aurantia]
MYIEKSGAPRRKPVTAPGLQAMKAAGQRIAALTAYDASFAVLLERAEVDLVLVGDSLGMVVQGHATTLPVTVDEMVYHTRLVARGLETALLVADLPFLADRSVEHALDAARRLLAEGAAMVKVEGAAPHLLAAIEALTTRGVPVCGHLGLTPQSVHAMGGFKIQGRQQAAADRLLQEALQVQASGASAIVLEGMPSALASEITASLQIPTIGIGAGAGCDGQILVVYDLLGLTPGRRPKFSKDFLQGRDSALAAVQAYVADVKAGVFPGVEHSFD